MSTIATRNPPTVATRLSEEPWSAEFVRIDASWDEKAASVVRAAADLDILLDEMAYVDNSEFERAAVAFALPAVQTFSVSDVCSRLPAGDDLFVSTVESRNRTDLYRAQTRRVQAERAQAASRVEFLATCDLVTYVNRATAEDSYRIGELLRRTRRYASTGVLRDLDAIKRLVAEQRVFVARVEDRFGSYGMVGVAVMAGKKPMLVEQLSVSCRVAGRGCLEALLSVIARQGGGETLRIPLVPTEHNVPLRVALRRICGVASANGGVISYTLSAKNEAFVPHWLTVRADV